MQNPAWAVKTRNVASTRPSEGRVLAGMKHVLLFLK